MYLIKLLIRLWLSTADALESIIGNIKLVVSPVPYFSITPFVYSFKYTTIGVCELLVLNVLALLKVKQLSVKSLYRRFTISVIFIPFPKYEKNQKSFAFCWSIDTGTDSNNNFKCSGERAFFTLLGAGILYFLFPKGYSSALMILSSFALLKIALNGLK